MLSDCSPQKSINIHSDRQNQHLLEFLQQQQSQNPSSTCLTLFHNGEQEVETFTYSEMLGLAYQGYSCLNHYGLKSGDQIIIALPTGRNLIASMLGAFWGGIVTSIISSNPPITNEILSRIQLLGAKAIITEANIPNCPITIVHPQEILQHSELKINPVINWEDLAYVQFSSGSTGKPKGIGLTWQAIHSNLQGMRERIPLEANDKVFSWLPMYHDMGLFGGYMATIYSGAESFMADPSWFVRNPLRWFTQMASIQATVSPTSPSALLKVIQLLERSPRSQLDLSCLQKIIVGAELVSPKLITLFNEVLVKQYGVSPTALKPVYGLAEATLAVTIPQSGLPPKIDWVNQHKLSLEHQAIPVMEKNSESQGWTAVGHPLKQTSVEIRSGEDSILPERQIGTIWISSPSLTSISLAEGKTTIRENDWFNTGDLGYLAEGQLYIVGRSKDIIIKKGRNYYPARLEEIATQQKGVRQAAAFGVYEEKISTERVILLLEIRQFSVVEKRDRLRLMVRKDLLQAGYEVDQILCLPKGSLPLTSSGKIRRQEARQLFLNNYFSSQGGKK